MTPLSRNTESTVSQKSPNKVAASRYSESLDRPDAVAMILRLAPPLTSDRMGIVEADQPLSVRLCSASEKSMPCGFSGDTGTRVTTKPDPVAAFRVHHEDLPVVSQFQFPLSTLSRHSIARGFERSR